MRRQSFPPLEVQQQQTCSSNGKMATGSSLVPLLLLTLFVGLLCSIGFVAYTIVTEVSTKAKANMEKKHISFSKDGMKVSMKEVKDEDYKDQTQSVLVNMWNHTSFPAYKSRLWDNGAGPADDKNLKKRH